MYEPPGSNIPSENSRHAETVSTQQVVFVQGELVHQQELYHAQSEQGRDSTVSTVFLEKIYS